MSESPVHSLYHCFLHFPYSIVPKELADITAGQSALPLSKVMVTGRGLEEVKHHSVLPGQETRARSYRLTCLSSLTAKVVQQIILKPTSKEKGQEGDGQ